MDSGSTKELYDAISKRMSVREYGDEIIKPELCDKIDQFIENINKEEDIFKSKTRFLLMREDFSRIWTFGFIGGNKYWLCGCTNKDNELSVVGYCLKMEKIILFLSHLGLDSCWLGGTYTASCFTKALNLTENEKLVCVSPVGYRNPNKKGLISYFMKRKRNDWDKNFFYENGSQPMTEDKCTFFTKDIIEAVRWIPSAMNKQAYTIVFKDKNAHVFGNGSWGLYDGGIAMAHLEIACLNFGLNGHWERLDNPCENIPNSWKYLASFIC
jgi:nitroreductase